MIAGCNNTGWRLATLLLCGILVACTAPAPTMLTGTTMGSRWSVSLVTTKAVDADALTAGIQARFDRVDRQMSSWKADSELSRFNQAAAGSWHTLSDEFFYVLMQGLELAEQTNGAFDPTVGALVELWGFGAGEQSHQVPSENAIEQARRQTGWQRIQVDRDRQRVKQPGGVRLDLSAIAKGFAVDSVSEWLTSQGITHFLVELSGEFRAQGHNAHGVPWRVAVERPGAAIAEAGVDDVTPYVLALDNQAVATSGDYRHQFVDRGVVYSHHLDPRTGWPVPYEVASVTVVAPTGIAADPLGTTLTVMGTDAGMRWAQQHQLAVLMLVHRPDGSLEERMTTAFKHWLVGADQ